MKYRTPKKIMKLLMYRTRKVGDIMHKVSKATIAYAKSLNIDTIVIGHNNGRKQSINMGKIIRRGACQSANGTLIHADLNGSCNIVRRAIPEAFANGIEGVELYPRSLSIRQMIISKGGC